MDEYLQYMRTLRSQMNDVEDQAAKISVDEQMHLTTIQNLEKDLDSAKSEAKQLKEEVDVMVKEKGMICTEILEKQRKIASLESDSATLTQTLELVQQERTNLSAKVSEKRSYYLALVEDLHKQLQERKDWFNSQVMFGKTKDHKQENEEHKYLLTKLSAAKVRLDEIELMKSRVVAENTEMEHTVQKLKQGEDEFKPELKVTSIKNLEDEYNAFMSDLAGETEFLQSLRFQVQQLKGISHSIRCPCGEEYNVEMPAVDCL